MSRQKDSISYKRRLNKTEKINLLVIVAIRNAGKVLSAKDFYFQLLCYYPNQSEQFKSNVEIGKLLEQTTINSVRHSRTQPKFYICSKDVKIINH